jgi:hypothetical protein
MSSYSDDNDPLTNNLTLSARQCPMTRLCLPMTNPFGL